MLKYWKENNLIGLFKEVYNSGIILSGVSAGAACWFDCFLTDSDGPGFKSMNGIGLLTGSFTPHYSDSKERKNIEKILKTKLYQMVLLLMMVLQYFLLTENQQRFILLEKVIMLILLIKINNLT